MNRRRLAAIASVALALMGVAASGAGARPAAIVKMNVGDGLAIAGSKIQCGMSADVGYGLDLRGKRYIACGPSTSTKGGGYVALMASDGHVYILSIKTHKTVSSRMPASAVASGTRSAGRHGEDRRHRRPRRHAASLRRPEGGRACPRSSASSWTRRAGSAGTPTRSGSATPRSPR